VNVQKQKYYTEKKREKKQDDRKETETENGTLRESKQIA